MDRFGDNIDQVGTVTYRHAPMINPCVIQCRASFIKADYLAGAQGFEWKSMAHFGATELLGILMVMSVMVFAILILRATPRDRNI